MPSACLKAVKCDIKSAATVAACVKEMTPMLIGKSAGDIEDAFQMLYRAGFYRGGPILTSAISGIEQAMWDIKGKFLGVPVYELLGGKVRDRIEVYRWIGGDHPRDTAHAAREALAHGYHAVKMNGTDELRWIDTYDKLDDAVELVAAIREAVYALDTLGADGVKLATNSRGQYLGDEALDPLMEVLNERHAVIIIHPHRPTPYPEKIIATTPLAMYEYPAETTRAVVNMLSRNVLLRYPNLKVVVPHCGSFLPLALPRMKSILPAMVAQGYMQPIDWEGNLSRLYFDLVGSPTIEVLHSLLTITSPDHILYGSDYPYLPDAVLKANLQRLQQALTSDEELDPYSEDILRKNAERLFEENATDERCPGHEPISVPDLDTLSSGLRWPQFRTKVY